MSLHLLSSLYSDVRTSDTGCGYDLETNACFSILGILSQRLRVLRCSSTDYHSAILVGSTTKMPSQSTSLGLRPAGNHVRRKSK